MRTSIRIEIDAPPERVFRLCRDVTTWSRLLPHYRKVFVHGRHADRLVAQMVAVRTFGPLSMPVTWRAALWSDDSDPADLRLRFHHVRGVTAGMDVTWHIRPSGGGSTVEIEHDFRRHIPLLGYEVLPKVVDRFFVRPIARRTLATFKRLSESGTDLTPLNEILR